MPFISDRDLLALQPGLLGEVAWLAQTLYRGAVRVEAGRLIALTGSFGPAIRPGHIALAGEQPLEITALVSPTQLEVSLTRAAPDGPAIAPPDAPQSSGLVATFDPQIALAHHQVLRLLGLEPSRQAIDPDSPGESAVLNPRDLWMLEAAAALHLVYAAAAASLSAPSTLAMRADLFRRRFVEERARARAILDTNLDSRADAVRSPGALRLRRS